MSRALYRGSTPERVRPQVPIEEPGSPTKVRDEQGNEESCFPHSMRLWIKQNFLLSSSLHKYGPSSADPGLKSGKICDSPGGALSLNSTSGSTASSSCFCFGCSKKLNASSVIPLILLFLIGAFIFVNILGLNRPNPRVTFPPHNYRRAQLLAWKEVLRGGMLGKGSLVADPREVEMCPTEMVDYVPCYNVSASLEAGFSGGLEFEPHCELSQTIQCLVRAPGDYRILSKWPSSSKKIWAGNVQINEGSNLQIYEGENNTRFIIPEDVLKVNGNDEQVKVEIGTHAQEVSHILGLSAAKHLPKAKIRSVLDIGCGFGSLGAHLWKHDMLTMCIAPYEERESQVQITLERGFPAILGSFIAVQLPFPSSSYDIIHCADCGVKEHLSDDLRMLEVNRLLRVGGYFVWALPNRNGLYRDEAVTVIQNLTASLSWEMISSPEHDNVVIWQKTAPYVDNKRIHLAGKRLSCESNNYDGDWPWQQLLRPCITAAPRYRQVSVQDQLTWPSRLQLVDSKPTRLGKYLSLNRNIVLFTVRSIAGPAASRMCFTTQGSEDDETVEPRTWTGTVAEYWSLLTPNIFSEHPKRLGDEDAGHTSEHIRNMMDMNAGHGELNAALLMSGKRVWVMNVVPTSASNTLPFIFDRGLFGVAHDWCQPFPSYPRTYDFLHAADLLSQELKRHAPCGLSNLFLEMDRLLRPQGWVFLRDEAALVEDARSVADQLRWDSRVIEVVGDKEQHLLVCQKVSLTA